MAAEDTKTALDKLLGVVQGFKSDEQTGSSKGGWISAAVVGIMALIAVAIFAWQQWQAGKERAKLLHEKAVREEAEHQALVDADLAASEEDHQAALARAEELRKEIEQLETETERLEAERQRARTAIDKISSWEDVDAIVR